MIREDAFDDVSYPFDYKAELKSARDMLDNKIGMFASCHPEIGYRQLAKKCRISRGTLCAIAKAFELKRKPGLRKGFKFELRRKPRRKPRPRSLVGTSATFRVRHRVCGKKFVTAVTVTCREGTLVKEMRRRVAGYYNSKDVSVAKDMKTERRAEYTFEELLGASYRGSSAGDQILGSILFIG